MTDYYVDASSGNDSNRGSNPTGAWRSLARASQQAYQPGDELLLRRGGAWHENLRLQGRAPAGNVTLGAYGDGPRPKIDAGGNGPAIRADAPVGGWIIRNLELTSSKNGNWEGRIPGDNAGIFLRQAEPSESLAIEDCLIHDTEGPGIALQAYGPPQVVFSNVSVEHCDIYNAWSGVDFCGSENNYHTEYFSRFHIAHVTVHDLGADGIIPFCGNHGVVEYCTAYRTGMGKCRRSPVGIWFAWAKNCIIRYCESFDNHTAGNQADGGGFDIDGGCTGCALEYNYSHDNDGAGYLLCSWDPIQWPSTDCVCRYNLSVNDGLANDYASIMFWQADRFQVYNNTCIARKASALKFLSDTKEHLIANNIFYLDSQIDQPLVKSAFNISQNRFRNNLYFSDSGRLSFEVQGERLDRLPDFAALIDGPGELSAEPRWVDKFRNDVHLQDGSPCRGRGLLFPDPGPHDFYRLPLKPGQCDIGCATFPA
jgi:hypothetical protein